MRVDRSGTYSRNTRRATVGLVCAALWLAACGSDSSDGSTASDESTVAAGASTAPTGSPGGEASVTGEADSPTSAAETTLPPPSSDTLTIAVGATPNTFDPLRVVGPNENPAMFNITQGLFQFGLPSYQSTQPSLATGMEISSDGLTITIDLRDGVKFHDGTTFDAEAAKWNINRWITTPTSVQEDYEVITDITVVSPLQLQLTLSEPKPLIAKNLSTASATMISPASATEDGNSLDSYNHPVGTGPYIFGEYKTAESFTMTRNPDYWGPAPYYETIVYRFVPDANVRESLLLAGQVDMVTSPPLTDLPALEDNGDVAVHMSEGSNYTSLVIMNTTSPEFSDVRVRQAMNYAVDKDTIIDKVMHGAAFPADSGPASDSMTGACDVGSYPYDPEKAKQLLKEAGATNIRVTLMTTTGRYPGDAQTAAAIAAYLSEIGVTVDVQTAAWPSFVTQLRTPAAESSSIPPLHYLSIQSPINDAGDFFSLASSEQSPPGGINISYLADPTVDDLSKKHVLLPDGPERQEVICELGEQVVAATPWLLLYHPRAVWTTKAEVQGVFVTPNGQIYAGLMHE